MGVNLTEILVKSEISLKTIKGKIIAVDASNWIYQFLSVIRQPDGALLADSEGRVTSHLMGIFTRSLKLMQLGVSLVYIFDGKPPQLKLITRQKRQDTKIKAEAAYKVAVESHNIDEMRKYASMTSKLTEEMVEESKELLRALGIPIIQAPSEAEAQAAFLVKNNDAYAVGSQDTDSLLFGSPRTIRNLTFSGVRKTSKARYVNISPQLFDLKKILSHMGITYEQLIILSMLVGTDYNYSGIPQIGPKKALNLVKKYGKSYNSIFLETKWSEHFNYPWEDVFNLFLNIDLTKKYTTKQAYPNKDKILKMLTEKHNFSEERVNNLLDPFLEYSKKKQKYLGDFFD